MRGGLALGLLLALGVACGGAPARAGVTEWIPIEVKGGQVTFPVEIAGRPSLAIFDSGSMIHSVSDRVVGELGLRLGGRRYTIVGSGSREENVRSVSRLPVRLFNVPFELHDVPSRPLDIDLIVGAGFLKAFVLQLDYPGHRMRLITRDSVDLAKVANVEFSTDRGTALPAVHVELDGKERWMMLDTGNAGAIVMRRMAAEDAGWLERFKRAEGGFVDINANPSSTDVLVLPSLKLGPYELENVPVEVPAEGEVVNISGGRLAGPENDSRIRGGVRISGVLGYEVLRHFVVTIDYEREKMHVAAPAEEPATPPSPPAEPPPAGEERS